MKTATPIVILLLLLACSKEKESKESATPVTKIENVMKDTLSFLFNKAKVADTLTFDNYEPFIAFRSGNLFSDQEKDILLFTTRDNGLKVEWRTLVDGQWLINDVAQVDRINIIQFNYAIKDYNFDGYKDIYVQRGVSNGFSLSYGHIITIDPNKNKMTSHPETENLGDMKPDKEKKVIRSTEAFRCPTSMNVWDDKSVLIVPRQNGSVG